MRENQKDRRFPGRGLPYIAFQRRRRVVDTRFDRPAISAESTHGHSWLALTMSSARFARSNRYQSPCGSPLAAETDRSNDTHSARSTPCSQAFARRSDLPDCF